MRKISVIMPVYNAALYLNLAIESILKQTYNNFTFIIIDDYSTDNSYEIAKTWARQDSRIILEQNPKNRGIAASLNKALQRCQTDLVARMDADDISHADRFKRQVETFSSQPDLAVCGTLGDFIDENSATLEAIKFPCHPESIRKALPYFNPVIHPTYMVNRQQVNYHYNELAVPIEDYEFLARINLQKAKILNLPEKLIKCRRFILTSQVTSVERESYTRSIYKRFFLTRLLGRQIRQNQPLYVDNRQIRYDNSEFRCFKTAYSILNQAKFNHWPGKISGYLLSALISPVVRDYVYRIMAAKWTVRKTFGSVNS
jgi:glycosyltransferase involved in cell wall biosynthesis